MGNKKNTANSQDLASLSPEELLVVATELQATNETLTSEKAELEALVEELSSAVSSKTTKSNQIKKGKHTYELVTPSFWMGGVKVDIELLRADEALFLSAVESGNLKEITK